ncbi:hypothetical protein ALC57_01527 [Trachymyrmex cornetzi]|uniref:Uncharacterized protein n=1 Tax=Trachymyrmex cornetzi TaxID=471704 RepID=A0A151JQ11_9HYME|nr:hypothetical protein ALC57_01527 [Trachymyrmex cornetzi]
MQVKEDNITEPAYEVVMKKHVSKIIAKDINSMKKIGKGKIAIEMRTATAANSLVGHPELAKLGYTAFIPSHKVFRQGIIRGVPTSVSDAELKSNLRSSAKIIDFKRLNRRMTNNGIVEYTPSTTINIKFAGQILLKYVSLYFDMHNVSPFIPRVKTCFSCFRI